jgi:mRNA-degrading endonuclease toxin of MazEF toxin-antitoxin module
LPADVGDLRRGAVAWGVFPFAAQFPMQHLDADRDVTTAATIEEYVAARRGAPTAVQSRVKLRPLLLLHDGTRGDNEDVVGLRINSVKAHHKTSRSWARIEAHRHPLFFHLPSGRGYGLPQESIIALNSVTSVHKSAIWKVIGSVNSHEMQIINQRLIRVFGLDLAPLIAQKAHELLRRAGILRNPS